MLEMPGVTLPLSPSGRRSSVSQFYGFRQKCEFLEAVLRRRGRPLLTFAPPDTWVTLHTQFWSLELLKFSPIHQFVLGNRGNMRSLSLALLLLG